MQQQPSVGRAVHYVSHGTPAREDGTQAYGSVCRAATITELAQPDEDSDVVGVAVMNPTGMFFNRAAYDGTDNPEGGTWHWPERV